MTITPSDEGTGWKPSPHAPEIVSAGSSFAEAVYTHSCLSLREFEAARMRTAQLNGCMICQDFRAARDALALYSVPGETPTRSVTYNGPAPDEAFFAAIVDWTNSPLFSVRERLAIEFAERFALEPKVLSADEAFWARMNAHYSEAEVVDLAHCVAAWMGLGRVAHVLGWDRVCAAPPMPMPAAAE
ncbi:carboxymuconolactone decarboxylase family protein [Novosphingobium sp.]|uniref:carboxymuconolactone decarboxylase family protein n=1 Tax=Novosphingobium sp. TaxID=1874826 RepID=UPI00262BAF51|nr:carboxymuconolactone decarboxylase family protein [Novosphingobium sp.]